MDISLKMRGIRTLSAITENEMAHNLQAQLQTRKTKVQAASTSLHSNPATPSAGAFAWKEEEPSPQGQSAHVVPRPTHGPLRIQLITPTMKDNVRTFDTRCTLSELVTDITNNIDAVMAPFAASFCNVQDVDVREQADGF